MAVSHPHATRLKIAVGHDATWRSKGGWVLGEPGPDPMRLHASRPRGAALHQGVFLVLNLELHACGYAALYICNNVSGQRIFVLYR